MSEKSGIFLLVCKMRKHVDLKLLKGERIPSLMSKHSERLLSYQHEKRQAVIARYMRLMRFNRERFHREQNEQQEQYLLEILTRMEHDEKFKGKMLEHGQQMIEKQKPFVSIQIDEAWRYALTLSPDKIKNFILKHQYKESLIRASVLFESDNITGIQE